MALIKCKECGSEVSSEAETCPKCGVRVADKPMGCGTLIGVIFLVGIIISVFSSIFSSGTGNNTPAPQSSSPTESLSATRHRDDSSNFIAIYGAPDLIKSSENESPRPEIVTKQLIYKKANVRAVFVADAPAESPPPYEAWKLLGFQDQRTGQVLSIDETQRRMGKHVVE